MGPALKASEWGSKRIQPTELAAKSKNSPPLQSRLMFPSQESIIYESAPVSPSGPPPVQTSSESAQLEESSIFSPPTSHQSAFPPRSSAQGCAPATSQGSPASTAIQAVTLPDARGMPQAFLEAVGWYRGSCSMLAPLKARSKANRSAAIAALMHKYPQLMEAAAIRALETAIQHHNRTVMQQRREEKRKEMLAANNEGLVAPALGVSSSLPPPGAGLGPGGVAVNQQTLPPDTPQAAPAQAFDLPEPPPWVELLAVAGWLPRLPGQAIPSCASRQRYEIIRASSTIIRVYTQLSNSPLDPVIIRLQVESWLSAAVDMWNALGAETEGTN